MADHDDSLAGVLGGDLVQGVGHALKDLLPRLTFGRAAAQRVLADEVHDLGMLCHHPGGQAALPYALMPRAPPFVEVDGQTERLADNLGCLGSAGEVAAVDGRDAAAAVHPHQLAGSAAGVRPALLVEPRPGVTLPPPLDVPRRLPVSYE